MSASDETALHAEAYSFNGGWTWQKSNSYVSSGSYTWVPGTICVRDAAGNINYNRTNVSVPYNDSTLPVIDKIEVTPQEDAKEKTVTVTAHDDKALHAEAYSFNGGWTWQKSNSYTITESYTWVPGTICVRDAAGNINYNREKIEVICSSDSVAPKIESITVGDSTRYTLNKTVTVKATDEGSGVKEYSFDGGWTWQTSSVFVATEPKEWVPGTILVRDAEGNISYNREKIVADRVIQITDNKNGAGKVVTVLALDNGNGAPPVSYSFNGGTTWQTSNSYIVTGNTTWVPGTILAKDSLGNVNYNQDTIEVINGKTAIDVSSYQGYIDWEKVKASGVNYAIIRAVTWSGGQDGYWIIDPMFEQNVINAKNAGVKVGAYIYTYAFSDAEVNAEVAVFLNSANRLKSMGYSFDLPVFVDHEYPKLLTGVPDYNERTRLLKLEMDLLFQNGYYSGMYMSTSWAQKNVNAASLQAQGYDLWIADYRGYNGWGNSVVMWQYGSNGSVPGINGDVDMNYLYKDYSTIIDGSDNTGSGTVEPTLTVYDQKSGKNVTDSRLNILAAIVNNEVGGTALTGQDAAKLYKAQAIAAHSHLLYTYENQNTLPTVGLNYGGNYETIRQQIQEVENAVLTYGGKAANTVYTSSANGKTGYTNSSAEYWGTSLPYLVSVQSLYESYFGGEKYQGIVLTRTESQLKADLSKLVDPSYAAGIAPQNWIEITGRNEKTGYVTGIKIWGQEVSISKFYEEVTGAYSPAFEFSYANGVFTFTAWGNGHGVGMSQYGAMGMIGKGMMDWTQVLAHYYPGTTLQRI